MDNLERYLQKNVAKGVTFFKLCAVINDNNAVRVFIHPLHHDGESLDFEVRGNALIRTGTDQYRHLPPGASREKPKPGTVAFNKKPESTVTINKEEAKAIFNSADEIQKDGLPETESEETPPAA